jgi:hypothetical protein
MTAGTLHCVQTNQRFTINLHNAITVKAAHLTFVAVLQDTLSRSSCPLCHQDAKQIFSHPSRLSQVCILCTQWQQAVVTN